ncbi:MAG: S1 RNA-binding domain-containing protein [Candidatus Limivicinus sp.]
MELAVGQVLEGTVTGITKFGAFVSLEGGKSGLVHISEVANTFVNDVHDHVQIGQKVKVKVLSIGEAGKINLSIKRAVEAPRQNQPPRQNNPAGYQSAPRPAQQTAPVQGQVAAPTGNQDFEDRLKRFMQESDSRIADNRMYSERKQRSRRR